MVELRYELRKSWPKLAWVCSIDPDHFIATVAHGPMVEIGADWAVEAVWDGVFEKGDFDRTDLVFGSGIRHRDNELVFVSSASGIDRLWYIYLENKIVISNSLPGLLKETDLFLNTDYKFYPNDILTIETLGLYNYKKSIPSTGPDINIVYFNNLKWDGGKLEEVEKPDITPEFIDFKAYESYLMKTAESLGKNGQSSFRVNPVDMIVGLSTGYDSVAVAVVAKRAGCKKSVSITNPSSFWRGSDSGEKLAPYLALGCQTFQHEKKGYKDEISVWAGSGGAGGRNLCLFDYPKPLSLFFSGGYGDTVWERRLQGLNKPVGDYDELICEFRLIHGVFMTQVPWWGIRHAAKIQKISVLNEMQPWTLGNDYDRPIARRIGEEAGVPRNMFGIRKKNTASNTPFWWPATKEADDSFRSFLSSKGIQPPNKLLILFLSKFYSLIRLVNANLLFFVDNKKKWKPWLKSPFRHLFFIWANHSLRDKYYR